ncbi:MAG: phosphoadenosine phosphosulfate reductase family protein [Moorea sp. SIO3C2]|nr:phosphoadenosine phosphosulfate reductase family protein [Moorena sp. SIO3C2]
MNQLKAEKSKYPEYDRTIIAFSGGKDSLACVLWAIENQLPGIELWHHDVDGREGSTMMDWPVTRAYCEAIAKHLNLPLYFSWLEGGFEREMLRDNQRKAATHFETPDGGIKTVGGTRGKLNTRLKFPQKAADLQTRWCSAYLKVDVCSIAIKNQERFNHSKTLLITGERAEESAARSKYAAFEPDRADGRDGKKARHVDRLRPIHGWPEEKVWEIIERHNINAHPAYHLGWGRLSCMACIFGSCNQWATIRAIALDHFKKIADHESSFGVTIDRKRTVNEMADLGTPYQAALENPQLVAIAMGREYRQSMVSPVKWNLPAGAFGEQNGSI